MQSKLSAFQVKTVVNDKQTLYESILRNQLYAPKLKEMIMTQQFMKGVKGYEQFWLPKIQDIKLLNCVDGPPRHELAKMVSERMLAVDTGDARINAAVKRTADLVNASLPIAIGCKLCFPLWTQTVSSSRRITSGPR